VLPAPTLSSILTRAGGSAPAVTGTFDAGARRLVSVLFAAPDTAVVAGLRHNRALYDARSGHMWDLHVAGYYAYGQEHYDPRGFPLGGVAGDASARPGHGFLSAASYRSVEWWFSPRQFVALSGAVASAHAGCLARVPVLRGRRTAWTYSGAPEIVNFWVSGSTPDWESLVAHRVEGEGPVALGPIVESLTDWRDGRLPRGFQPGTRPRAASQIVHADALRRGLSWTVAGAAGAAVSEGATALVGELMRLL
jgi:hypothetical protein